MGVGQCDEEEQGQYLTAGQFPDPDKSYRLPKARSETGSRQTHLAAGGRPTPPGLTTQVAFKLSHPSFWKFTAIPDYCGRIFKRHEGPQADVSGLLRVSCGRTYHASVL